MPLYEYLCESCGERTEILQRFNDLPEVACPECGAPMRRLPSAPSIQFKGSGFYLTDYAKKSGGTEGTSPRSGSDKAADKAGEKGSEAGAAKSAGAGRGPGARSAPRRTPVRRAPRLPLPLPPLRTAARPGRIGRRMNSFGRRRRRSACFRVGRGIAVLVLGGAAAALPAAKLDLHPVPLYGADIRSLVFDPAEPRARLRGDLGRAHLPFGRRRRELSQRRCRDPVSGLGGRHAALRREPAGSALGRALGHLGRRPGGVLGRLRRDLDGAPRERQRRGPGLRTGDGSRSPGPPLRRHACRRRALRRCRTSLSAPSAAISRV